MNSFFSLHEFALAAGIPENVERVWIPYQEELLNRDDSDLSFLLEDAYQMDILKRVGLPDEEVIRPKLRQILRRAKTEPVVRKFLLSAFYLLFCTEPRDSRIPVYVHLTLLFPGFSGSEKLFGEDALIANLIVLFGAGEMIRRKHREQGIPEDVTNATIHTLRSSTVGPYKKNGISGIALSSIPWSREYADGRLFRLGRLNFWMHTYPDFGPILYRKRDSDELRVLCRAGWKCPSSATGKLGQTRLLFQNSTVTGTLIPPSGEAILEREVTLDLTEWGDALSPWDLTPSVHIPTDDMPMEPELVKESFKKAVTFFETFFHRRPKLFVCQSWILNTRLQSYMPDSNIVWFQKQGYLRFTPGYPRAAFPFIFGRNDGELSSYPAQTRLQKALLELAAQPPENTGTGFWFIEADKTDQIGVEYYQKRYAFLEPEKKNPR